MKLSLVVKTPGKQEGKALAIPVSEFIIGRDPQCHLRPASPMISKRHCALVQRDGKAYVLDFGSTNGTSVNDQPVQGEAELHNGDVLKVGPIVFEVRLVQDAPAAKGATPKPPTKPMAGMKSAAAQPPAGRTPLPPGRAPDDAAKTAFEMPAAKGKAAAAAGADDDIAAMLLSLHDDDSPPSAGGAGDGVPEGSTVMEMILPKPGEDPAKAGDKGKEKEKPKASGNTASAAKSILEQYMKRPRG